MGLGTTGIIFSGCAFTLLVRCLITSSKFVPLRLTALSGSLVAVPPGFAAGSTRPHVVDFSKAGSGVMNPGLVWVANGIVGPVPSACLLVPPEGEAVSLVVEPSTCVIFSALQAMSEGVVSDLLDLFFIFILLSGKAGGPTVVDTG